MSRADVLAHAQQLAGQLDDEHAAVCPIPRGLHQATRAQVLDLLTGAVAELRKTRDVHARTIAGERLDRGDECELVIIVWQGDERPSFFDEDGGDR